jgi:ABC-type branched-subunit amino acid transport system substrate-binding protein
MSVLMGFGMTAAGASELPVTRLSSEHASPFVVGAVEPLSGTYATLGEDTVNALKAQASILNKHGGILGHKIEIRVDNDASSEQEAISATQQLIQSGSLNMFEPDIIYGQTELPLTSHLLTIDICTAPQCGDGSTYPLTFTMNPSAASQVPPGLAYAKQLGDTKVGVIATNDQPGQSFTQTVQADARSEGVSVVGAQSFDPSATNIATQLESLRSSGAQAVASWSGGTTVGVVMTGMQSIGWKAPVLGTGSVFTADVTAIVPASVQSQLKCLCYRVMVRQGSTVPTAVEPLVKGMAKYGTINSMAVAALAADTLTMADYGYTKAGKLNAQLAANAIAHVGADKNFPTKKFYTYRDVNPGFTPKDHSPIGASLFKGLFGVASVSQVIDGTFEGEPFSFK